MKLRGHARPADGAYIEHVASTLLEGAREARLLVSLRFDAQHIRDLLQHMVDLHDIVEEAGVTLGDGVQQEIAQRLAHAVRLLPAIEPIARTR
jgi:hypothetical protein